MIKSLSTIHLTRYPFARFVLLSTILLSLSILFGIEISTAYTQDIPESERCANPANPVVAENCLPGTDNWMPENYATNIKGYPSATSANHGESLTFFVDTEAADFDILIYRTGYYGGIGARLVDTVNQVKGQKQPDCSSNFNTGLSTCANWSPSYTFTVPEEWVSGVYFAKLVRADTGGENYILFTVRDDASHSQMLFQSSTTTYQAYNNEGGKSLYRSGARNSCNTLTGTTRAVEVSSNRPIMAQQFAYDYNVYSHGEFALVYWLEAQGYDVSYFTSEDTNRSGKPDAENKLLNHKIFLSVGHDEYWTQAMRDALTAARDAGVNIAFFSSNVGYWRIRLEPDPVSGEPDSTIITYKTTESGPEDPTGFPTGTWRDPNGVNNPENALIGIQYIGDNNTRSFPLRVSAEYAKNPIYRHTGLQSIPDGSYVNIGQNLIGWEWDAVFDNGKTPPGLEVLASTPVNGETLLDAGRQYSTVQFVNTQVTRYTASSGAIVFATGTNRWTLGLGWFEPNPLIQQITYNLFSDMGVQPTTPAASLILDTDTSDRTIEVNQGGRLVLSDQSSTPLISDIQISPEDEGAVFNWNTDLPTNGQVWFSTTSGQVNKWSVNTITDYVTSHALNISDLEPGTTYYYHIVSSAEDENAVISDEGQFTTTAGSVGTRLRKAVEPVYYPARCWVISNPPIALGIVIVAAGVLLFGVWRLVRFLRRPSVAIKTS